MFEQVYTLRTGYLPHPSMHEHMWRAVSAREQLHSPHGQDVGKDLFLVPLGECWQAEDEDSHDEVEEVRDGQSDQQGGERARHPPVSGQPDDGEDVPHAPDRGYGDEHCSLNHPREQRCARRGRGHAAAAAAAAEDDDDTAAAAPSVYQAKLPS